MTLSEEENPPSRDGNPTDAQSLEADIRAELRQNPHNLTAQEMWVSIEKLQALPGVEPSVDFEDSLRQKITRLPPRKPLWRPKAVWPMGITAAVLLTVFWVRLSPISPDPIGQALVTLNQSAFEDELKQIHPPFDKSEVDLSQEMLKYPADQIHPAPSLDII